MNAASDDTLVLSWERRTDPEGVLIPMAVRMKLDLCGRKIRLHQWQALPQQERVRLAAAPCDDDAAIKAWERALLGAAGLGEPALLSTPEDAQELPWREPGGDAPAAVAALAVACGAAIQWSRLSRFARFVLFRLAAKDDRERFLESLEELAAAGHLER